MSHFGVTMSIKTFKQVAVMLPPWTSVLLRANHGVGKSKVVRQVVALLRNKIVGEKVVDMSKFKNTSDFLTVIDRRLSQMTEGDMVGLPSTDGETTRFNPPDWYKKACTEPTALFLDELNRATPEVMQAAFQIVLDRELNGWKLHPETRVYAAINIGASYNVNEMDPALLDRFFVVDLEPNLEEWCAWARDTDPVQGGNLHYFIPDFIQSTKRGDGTNWLFSPKGVESNTVTTSPRSWEGVHKALTHAGIIDDPENELFYHMVRGFVGNEAAIAFRDYCRNVDSRITGEELVNEYHKKNVRAKVKRLGQGHLNDVVAKASAYVVNELSNLTPAQGENLKQIMSDLPDELKIDFWSKLTIKGIDKIELCKAVHKYCCELVLQVFGVPMGEAGVGVVPNIPGIFSEKSKTANPSK